MLNTDCYRRFSIKVRTELLKTTTPESSMLQQNVETRPDSLHIQCFIFAGSQETQQCPGSRTTETCSLWIHMVWGTTHSKTPPLPTSIRVNLMWCKDVNEEHWLLNNYWSVSFTSFLWFCSVLCFTSEHLFFICGNVTVLTCVTRFIYWLQLIKWSFKQFSDKLLQIKTDFKLLLQLHHCLYRNICRGEWNLSQFHIFKYFLRD